MKKVEKRRSNKRRHTRMSVQAYCTCPEPYNCIQTCGTDDITLYNDLEAFARLAASGYRP